MESNNTQIPKIIVFGRTGAGKSSLGNGIFDGKELFKVGQSMFSETIDIQRETRAWPLDESKQVTFIDTPGFADNRPGVKNSEILSKIRKLLEELKGGFNIGLFCWAAQSRFDANDVNELEILGELLGSEVFAHMWIVVTKINTLQAEEQTKKRENVPKELPQLLEENLIVLNAEIYFPDLKNRELFEKDFLIPLNELINECPTFVPEAAMQLEEQQQIEESQALQQLRMMPKVADKYVSIFKKETNDAIQRMKNSRLKTQVVKNEEEIKKYEAKIREFEAMKEEAIKLQEKRQTLQKKWDWNRQSTLQLSFTPQTATLMAENYSKAFDEVKLEHSLTNGKWSWIVIITHKEGFITKAKNFLFAANHPTLGFKDEMGNSYYITYRGVVKKNLRNTPEYSTLSKTLNAATTVELLCELDFSEKKFQVSYQGKIIVNHLALKNGIQIRPFVGLCKGDKAVIQFIKGDV